jgi:hypothetical protein
MSLLELTVVLKPECTTYTESADVSIAEHRHRRSSSGVCRDVDRSMADRMRPLGYLLFYVAAGLVAALALVVCSLETGLRLGANSPDTRFTLPRFSLGYFWDTPLGWTGVVDGVPVN